jgi:hypothetical protein
MFDLPVTRIDPSIISSAVDLSLLPSGRELNHKILQLPVCRICAKEVDAAVSSTKVNKKIEV